MKYNVLWASGVNVFDTARAGLLESFNTKAIEIELTEKYHTQGLIKELSNNTYKALVVYEYLEKSSFDIKLLESFKELNKDLNLVFIISDSHVSDNYVKELINRGIFDVLYEKDVTPQSICDLVIHPRGRTEAKHYLRFEENVEMEVNSRIDKKVIQTIVYHLTETPTDNKAVLFREIFGKFGEEDSFYILDSFPTELLEILHEEDLVIKYKKSKTEFRDEKQEGGSGSGKLKNILGAIQSIKISKEGSPEEKEQVEIIEKIVEVPVKELDNAIITIYSAKESGKSFIAWNLAHCFTERDYKTTVINLDQTYSANIYYPIEEVYYELLGHMIKENRHKEILDFCYKRGLLSVITGSLGDSKDIAVSDFDRLLFYIKAKSNITMIDCRSGLADIVRAAIRVSNIDLLVFNCDFNHFHMNKLMIQELKDDFVPEKTIAIINNCDVRSESYKYMFREIEKLGLPFKEIGPISSCGMLGCNQMGSNVTPYEAAKDEYKQFKEDINNLLYTINSREKKTGFLENIRRKVTKRL